MNVAPHSHEFNNKHNLAVFEHLGLDVKESVSLMGAHTIGGVNTCTGFPNLEHGAYC